MKTPKTHTAFTTARKTMGRALRRRSAGSLYEYEKLREKTTNLIILFLNKQNVPSPPSYIHCDKLAQSILQAIFDL